MFSLLLLLQEHFPLRLHPTVNSLPASSGVIPTPAEWENTNS